MSYVLDASFVAAALVGSGPTGQWAEDLLESEVHWAAPHLMPVEVANILRRSAMAGELSQDLASMAHRDLGALRVDLFAYEPLADRIWALRSNLTAFDAWYVALAEALDATLLTLDTRLAKAPGTRCKILLPSSNREQVMTSSCRANCREAAT